MAAALLRGTLDLLILRTLTLGPGHGLDVGRRIAHLTKGTFDVKPGSLFPALHRLEEQGFVSSRWGESDQQRRVKLYQLTKSGRRQVETETAKWKSVAQAIGRAIEATS